MFSEVFDTLKKNKLTFESVLRLSSNLESLNHVVKRVMNIVPKSSIILFVGSLGNGKTTLVRELSKNVLINEESSILEEVNSPTYSLVNKYSNIVHADLYRLETAEELVHLELDLYFDKETEFFFIEWPDKFINEIISSEFYDHFKNKFLITIGHDHENAEQREYNLFEQKNEFQ